MKMRNNGFTLVELLLVTAIMMLLLSVGALSFFGFKQKNEIDGEAGKLEAILKYAQQKSISQSEQDRWLVHLDSLGANDFYGVRKSMAGATEFERYVAVGSGVEFKINNSPASGDIYFEKIDGKPTSLISLPISIVFTEVGAQGGYSATVQIYANGLINRSP